MTDAPPTRAVVLCVDDEPLILSGLTLHLSRHYEVHTTTSAKAALEAFPLIKPDVVVSDMRMPGMTGLDLFVRLRSFAPQVSRILLTGGTDLTSALASVKEGGITSFLIKPCPPTELREAIENGVARTRALTNADGGPSSAPGGAS